MIKQHISNIDTIFVDCFDTIIFRKMKSKEIFKTWAKELSSNYNMPWKVIYKTYSRCNFNMCVKGIFSHFNLIANFNNVVTKMYTKLHKTRPSISSQFVDDAISKYCQIELNNFIVNENIINFLRTEKQNGKSIYLVSDFYCKSDVLKMWFNELNISNIFDEIFSSSDFDKEKATTRLYVHLINLLNLNPKSITMYGDNPWSDILMSKMCKLNAKRIKNKG